MTIEVTRRGILRGSLGGAAGLLGGAMLPTALVSGATLRIRRDIDSLAIDDPMILTYATAVRYLRSLPTGDRRNWDRLSNIHSNLCPHQNWYLLPWHREYLLALERIIRRLPPGAVPGAANFIMPYWDWARNPRLPAAVSRPTLLDGTANPLYERTRAPTATATIPAELVGSGAMRRAYAPTAFESFGSARPYGQANTQSWWQWEGSTQGPLEATPHNGVHNWIGGKMVTMTSPRDPLFFLHHANVDRIWASWNAHGHANSNATNWLNFTFARNFPRPDGSLYDVKVRDIGMTGYGYDRLDPRPAAAKAASSPAMASFTLRATDVAALAAAATDPLAAGNGAVTRQIRLASRRVLPSRAVLRILNLTVPQDLLSKLVRVFVNHPAANRDPAPEGPFYVGTLAFFGGAGRADVQAPFEPSDICTTRGNCFSFELPLDDLLERWRAESLPLAGTLTIQLVPIEPGNRLAKDRLQPAAIEVTFF
ncbi:MAG: tyrosinase family protein [Geminicoccaceae bacterium]